ncbi:ParA family protein [Acaryochloris marina]|uniref:Chromosome partitioning protein, ParA family, putative n=1 Tax=Acaryochloris marina (strain MBIC 11017) TaxID=329726 RepID=A8ZKQ3_ACAM1|nr:ParA family protein [Acaryochloris marina]ABW31371.1 chromosome partitioning protein, ParA family, putative [Acaryochloris marina MBIC11017]
MAKILAFFNHAGGVGKTTLVQQVGYHLSQCKRRVKGKRSRKKGDYYRILLVDMDPQASLTTFMGIEPYDQEKTIYNAILKDEELPILNALYAGQGMEDSNGLDLVASNLGLAIAEQELMTAVMKDFRLRDSLEPIKEEYDFILIDCPPSLGNLTYISLVAATHLLVPIQSQYKAFKGVQPLFDTVRLVSARPNKSLKIAGFIPTMYDQRNSHDERTLAAIQQQLTPVAKVFSPIPRTTTFADASEENLPLALFDNKHPALEPIKVLAEQLESLAL